MKKRLFLALFVAFLSFNLSHAQENTINNIVSTTSMPTDEQIWRVVDSMNIEDAQKTQVFQATKNELKRLYSAQETTQKLQQELNQTQQQLKQIQNQVQTVGAGTQIQENIQPVQQITPKREKKYSKHDPLFKKQRLGPKR